MSFQPPPDNYASNPRNPLLPDSRPQPRSYNPSYSENQPASKPSVPNLYIDEPGNYNVGILPGSNERGPNRKHEYGKVLMTQAKEREMNEKRKKQEEKEFEKRLLEQRMNNDPFGRDRQRYLNAYHRSNMNARNGFVGIGNQIVNQAPSISSLKEEVYERPSQQEPEIIAPPVNTEKNNEELKKAMQEQEMRRMYEEQMAEQERRRLEELRRKIQEEKDEVEKIRSHNSMQLLKQTEENNKILQQQIMMQNFAQQSYMSFMAQTAQAAQMQQQYVAQMLATPPPIQRREPTPPPPEPEPEIPDIDFDAIRELEEEKLRAIKANMYTDMSRQVNSVVNQEMNRLKHQMGQQSHMLKDQLLILKNQVLLAEELKQDADNELEGLKKEAKGLDIYEDIRTRNLSKYLKNVSHLYTNTDPISDNGNFEFQFPTSRRNRNIPVVNRNTGNYELMAEVHHLPVQEPRYNPKFSIKEKEPDVLLRESMGSQYGIPTDDYTKRTRGLVLPDHIDLNTKNPYYQEARTANHLRGKEFDILDNLEMDAFEKNSKRLDVLDNLYHDHDTKKLDMLLRDSLLREHHGGGGFY